MKIGSVRKIVVEDFSADNRKLVTKLATVLNPFLDQVTTALSNNLTVADNVKSKTWEVDLKAGTTVKKLAWELNEKPTSVQIARLTKSNDDAPGAVFAMSWTYGNGTVTVTFLGLDGATDYKATLIGQV